MPIDRQAATRALDAFLSALGRDPQREPELVGTAERVALMYADELLSGYAESPSDAVRPHVIEGGSGIVALHDITVTTVCPHHLMPATGRVDVAFAPSGRIIGLGAVVKLVEVHAHRLVLQEQIGERVASTLSDELGARWVACRLVLEHTCMSARGERRHGVKVETIAYSGSPADRAEAIDIVRGCP
jgi:GTP cyclohydrolase I